MISMSLKGVQQMQQAMKKAPAQVAPIILRTMNDNMQEAVTKAKEYCPVDSGALRASGRADKARRTGASTFEGELGFYKEYAIYVHEDLNARHPVGQAKFLERAVHEQQRAFVADLAAALRRWI